MADEDKNKVGDAGEPSLLGQLIDEAGSVGDADGGSPDEMELLKRQVEYEKQRNDSLQGRIDSQLKPMNDLVKQLRSEVAELKGGAEPIRVPQLSREEILAELTPEERSKIGDKQLDVLMRLIEKPVKVMAEKLEQKLVPRIKATEAQVAGQIGEELWAKVDQISPGAKETNDREDGDWVSFLSSVDPASGKPYRELGNAAVDAGDVGRLAQIHDLYKKAREKGGAPGSLPDWRTQLRPAGTRAEPSRGEGGGQPSIKRSEMEKFYADLSRGKYSDKPELAEKMDAAISKAVEENRIVPG